MFKHISGKILGDMHFFFFIWCVWGGGGGACVLYGSNKIGSTATLSINTKLPIALSDFYKECIVTWTSLCEDNPPSLSEIANQIIWNNLSICTNSKSIYFISLFSAIHEEWRKIKKIK